MSVPATLEQNVKERIKGVIGELIPEEMWDRLVRDNVEEFKKVDLPKLVKTDLAERYKKAIDAEFSKPEWQTQWGNAGQEGASEMVKKIMVESASDVLAGMVGSIVQQMLYNLRSQVQQYR
jgi:hypothetical protein